MHIVWCLRTLTVIAALMLALSSIVVHCQPPCLDYLPERQAQALRDFYGFDDSNNRKEIHAPSSCFLTSWERRPMAAY